MYNLNYDDLLFQLRNVLRLLLDDQEINENGRYKSRQKNHKKRE
jgi:hypothetical protein